MPHVVSFTMIPDALAVSTISEMFMFFFVYSMIETQAVRLCKRKVSVCENKTTGA